MWLNQDSLARSLTHAASTLEVRILTHAASTLKYASTYIHPFPCPELPKNILLLIQERIARNISAFPL